MSDGQYVTTDRNGVQRSGGSELAWDLEHKLPADGSTPSGLDGEELLEWLDERVFTLEQGAGAQGLRLGRELDWSPERAAVFALDCLEHAFADDRDLALPRDRTLGEVIDEARAALGGGADRQHFTALGRFTRLRHLRRTRDVLGAAALSLAKQDEREDLELADDPAWTTLAALGEGVLAALEALREAVGPRYAARREGDVVTDEDVASTVRGESPWITPWGPLSLGIEHVPAHRPAAHCAREAAERARRSVTDRGDEQAGAAELAWQVERLEAILRGA